MKWDTSMWCLPKTLWWLSQKKKRFLERNWLGNSFWMNFWVYLWILSLLSFIVVPDLNGQWISYLCPTVSALPMGALMYTAHLLLLLSPLLIVINAHNKKMCNTCWDRHYGEWCFLTHQESSSCILNWVKFYFIWYFELETFRNNCCKDQIWISSPTDRWTKAQKAKNNKFVKNELENWVLMNQTNTKVDLDDKM